jgi:uncharacterized cupin superfamily protein
MSEPSMTADTAALIDDLEDWGPRSGADSGTPMMSGRVLHDAGGIEVGIWRCTPGGWSITDRQDTESVLILAGRARITDASGDSSEITAGSALVLPKGWSGRWDILDTVVKHYVIVR